MASAWGGAFGSAWGNSWGAIQSDTTGGGGPGTRRKRKDWEDIPTSDLPYFSGKASNDAVRLEIVPPASLSQLLRDGLPEGLGYGLPSGLPKGTLEGNPEVASLSLPLSEMPDSILPITDNVAEIERLEAQKRRNAAAIIMILAMLK